MEKPYSRTTLPHSHVRRKRLPDYSVSITLGDGKERHLRYDFNALIALENAGFPLDGATEIMNAPLKHLKEVRTMIWAGLIHEEKSITQDDVGALMLPLADMNVWADLSGLAMMRSMKMDAGEPKNVAKPETKASDSPAATTSTEPAKPPTE